MAVTVAAPRTGLDAPFPWDRLAPPDVAERACTLCESPRLRQVWGAGQGRENRVGTLHCAGCTGLITSPRHEVGVLARFYEEHFPRYTPLRSLTADGEVTSGDALVRARFVVDATEGPRGWRVLEVGSGSGEFLAAMCRAGAREGLGLEPALSVPEVRKGPVALRRHAVLNPAALDEGTFDLIAMFHVLEHVVDPVQFLAGLRRHLAAPGYVVLEVPNLYRYRFPHPDRYFKQEHLTNFTPRSLRLVAAKAGLHPVRWNRVGAKHLRVVLATELGRRLRRDTEGPGYRRCRAYLKFIGRFARLEVALGPGRWATAALRLAARAGARLILGSVVP